ncbi:class I SAM-dependent methyltransferase [Streptomyces sp. NPDC028722]|uniref:class I SAM-dependent methyltransferase n=1 Tax=Streptomyces sp. NPDC028722 TaxID=3155016 RepID=UPI0033E1BAE0
MGSPGLTERERQTARVYDAMHAARAHSTIADDLYAQAMGDLYPYELDASSSCDWPLLGTMVANLRMEPGHQLVDLACGTGGAGLWLARALAVYVTGIDVSATAVQLATGRVPEFWVPAERARFAVGSLARTGLPDRYANGLICVDGLGFEHDRRKSLEEIRRVLKPGARAVLTSSRPRLSSTLPPWEQQAENVGLVLEAEQERPHEPPMWQRLYTLWAEHEAELRAQLGDAQAESMLTEARTRGPQLRERQALVVTLRRPEE